MDIINLNTYVITLNKNLILDKLSQFYKLNPQIVNGILYSKNLTDLNIKNINTNLLPKSIIGCALSHIKCWKKHILKLNNYTLILEDDFFIKNKNLLKNIDKLINFYILNTPKDFDILYLGYISGSCIKKYFTLSNNINNYKNINKYIEIPELHLGLHSYIISNRGIVNLLNKLDKKKINFHLDYYIQSLASKNKLITYAIKDRLFFQTSTYLTKSNNISKFKCSLFQNYYIDEFVTLNYLFNVSILSIYDFDINLWFIIILIFILLNLYTIIRCINFKKRNNI